MHKLTISEAVAARVEMRVGRPHAFDAVDPRRTALLVVDMQNYFVKPGFQGAIPMAIEIVPAINRLACELRRRGGHVVWIRNSPNDTKDSWSVFNNDLMTPQRSELRAKTMDESHEGFEFWHLLDIQPGDGRITKKRFSAFIRGSSDIERYLNERGLDTLLIAGTATNVCCDSTARDAMMLNFKVVMVHDACATYSDEEHSASLTAFYNNFGDIQSVDEAIGSLDRRLALAAEAERKRA